MHLLGWHYNYQKKGDSTSCSILKQARAAQLIET